MGDQGVSGDGNRLVAAVSVDVLYHRQVGDDAQAVREMGRVCEPGGVTVLWLPAYDWLRSRHDEAVHTARRYTRARVRALCRAAELEPVVLGYAHASILPLAMAVCLLEPGSSPKSAVEEAPGPLDTLLGGWLAAEGRLALQFPFPFGLSVLAVLRRPTASHAHGSGQAPRSKASTAR